MAGLDYDLIKNWPLADVRHEYGPRDTILYALGVGAATSNPVPADDLQYVYERGLKALPSMAAILAGGPFWLGDPKTGIVVNMLLHGEQSLTLHRPLPAQGTVIGRDRIDEIYDKGAEKGAVLYMTRDLFDAASGALLATAAWATFMRGNGGFGGSAQGQPRPHDLPAARDPDLHVDLPTRPEQAVIYRLSGDFNPLHIDPAVAAKAGFDRPILHGMSSYGIAGRAILKGLCDNDPTRLRKLNLRFAAPVYPGETLRTEIWREGEGQAGFRVKSVERDLIILNNGYAEYAV